MRFCRCFAGGREEAVVPQGLFVLSAPAVCGLASARPFDGLIRSGGP